MIRVDLLRGPSIRKGVTFHAIGGERGVHGTLRQLADYYGVSYGTVVTRMRRGKSLKQALGVAP